MAGRQVTRDSHTETAGPPRPRPRRLRRFVIGCAAGLTALVLAAAIALVALVGTRLSAPGWLRTRIADHVNDGLGGARVEFDDVSVLLQDDWVPRLALRGARIFDAAGRSLLNFSELQATVAPGPLLRGELRPGTIRLSGARLTLRRGADGALALSLGERDDAVHQAPTLAGLAAQVEGFFRQPELAALRRVSADNLTLRYEDARADKAWTVDGAHVTLTRKDGALDMRTDLSLLGARDYATTLAMHYSGRIGEVGARVSVEFEDMPAGDIASQLPALAWLKAFEAPVSGRIAAAVDDAGRLGPLDVHLKASEGVVRPTPAARPVRFTGASTHFTYDPATQELVADALAVDSKWLRARITGRTRLVGMEDGWPDALISQFRVGRLDVNPMALYDAPVRFEGATLDMRLDLDPFRVTLGQFSLTDQGQTLVARGVAKVGEDGWSVSADARLPGIAPDRLMALWPAALEPKTREWISENVRTANVSNIELALRLRPGTRPNVVLGFDFSDVTARFIKKVPPIEGASGHATIEDNRFVLFARQGHVTAQKGGRIDISGSSFEIPDLRIKRGPGKVRLRTRSTITAGLSLLDSEPFRFLTKAGRPVTLAEGRGRLQGQLDFLVKDNLTPEEVAFEVHGTLSDVKSDKLLKGRVITARELSIEADREHLKIAGAGHVGKVPFEGSFRMPLTRGSKGQAHVEGRIELSPRFADEFGIALPPGSIAGAAWAHTEIEFAAPKAPVFTLSSDLDGLMLQLRPLHWRLAAAGTGRLEVTGALARPPRIDRISLDAAGLRAEGAVSLKPGGGLERAVFSRVRLGTWLDAPVELVGRGPGTVPLVRVNGGEIDLRQTSLSGEGGEPAQEQGQGGRTDAGTPLELHLDRLRISDTIALTGFSANVEMAGGARGSFAGQVNGGSKITGQVVPRDGRAAFRILSDDAGGVMRSAGLLDRAREGKLDLVLVPGKGEGLYEGRLKIRNIRVKDAPAMAALLNAVSIVGILDQLNGEGIHFSDVEAKFQLAPKRVTIYSASAVGASMGISMEGYYWPEAGQLDVQGVISPVYAVNMLGGVFSRRGEGFLGFNYALKGPKDAPRVRVNPLSVFTPGLFREIFRRPPPRAQDEAQTPAPEPDSGDERQDR